MLTSIIALSVLAPSPAPLQVPPPLPPGTPGPGNGFPSLPGCELPLPYDPDNPNSTPNTGARYDARNWQITQPGQIPSDITGYTEWRGINSSGQPAIRSMSLYQHWIYPGVAPAVNAAYQYGEPKAHSEALITLRVKWIHPTVPPPSRATFTIGSSAFWAASALRVGYCNNAFNDAPVPWGADGDTSTGERHISLSIDATGNGSIMIESSSSVTAFGPGPDIFNGYVQTWANSWIPKPTIKIARPDDQI